MGDPTTYHFKLPTYAGPLLEKPPQAAFPGVEDHVPACTSDRTIHADGLIRAFVIHATAGSSSTGAMSVMFEHQASWHWLVPDEDEAEHGVRIWTCAPEARAAWHVRNSRSHPGVNAGRTHVNYWSLGVEVVNRQTTDPFSEWQVHQTAALVRYAWSRYPTLVDVVSHAKLDPGRRRDPGAEFPWTRFRDLVLEPTRPVSKAVSGMARPIRVIGPTGRRIACDPRALDGVTVVEARPLIEALGFRVEYGEGEVLSIRVRPNKIQSSRSLPGPRTRRPRGKAKGRAARGTARRSG